MILISEHNLKELKKLLNRVADERAQDSDGPGSYPTHNAYAAREILQRLGLPREKGPGVI